MIRNTETPDVPAIVRRYFTHPDRALADIKNEIIGIEPNELTKAERKIMKILLAYEGIST